MKRFEPFPRASFRASGKNIYLDHNATTPIASFVQEAVIEDLSAWGNAGSIHQDGRGPKSILRESRKKVAELIGAHPLELVFTSGGSESNNMVLKGLQNWAKQNNRDTLIISAVEHPSVMQTALYLEAAEIFKLQIIPVNIDGVIDINYYQACLNERVALVSIMMANNETGSIFPVKEMAQAAHAVGALFHTDGVQALGKLLFDVKDLDVDFMTFSAHKFYALKGAGAVYIKKGLSLEPLIHGGSQERKRRSGTENILAIASFGKMAETKEQISQHIKFISELHEYLEKEILNKIDGVKVTGAGVKRICGTSSLVIKGIDGETLLMNLDVNGFSVSTGAACSSGNPEPSPVLLNMGLSREEAQSSLRLSLGWGNTKEDVDQFIIALEEVVAHVRRLRGSDEKE